MSDRADDNLLVGQRTQEKLEFYVLALTFTVLGLAVQTATFGASRVAGALELLAWIALLVSGMLGLWRMEGVPHFYDVAALKNEYDRRAQGLRKVIAMGERSATSLDNGGTVSTAVALKTAEASLATIDVELKRWTDVLGMRRAWQRRTFVGGFVLLLIARAFVPVEVLASALGSVHR